MTLMYYHYDKAEKKIRKVGVKEMKSKKWPECYASCKIDEWSKIAVWENAKEVTFFEYFNFDVVQL